ncbi:hypothetical protein [Nocardioides sp. SYSU D00038]|uniref:hypothetical protein n=1 Tax=Nocardioides sp. SYSU D00038 TaxID=2812554 RepID=UPI001967A7CA|nr:hypothetical protein [Nocardioides sp. SYSU D00038]
MHTARRRPRSASARGPAVVTAALLATLLATLLGGCTGDDEPDAGPSRSAAPEAAGELATRTTIGKVSGRLRPAGRQPLKDQLTALVDRWWDAAYLGAYPRTDFEQAFPGFTSGARREARRQQDLMTNAATGAELQGVTPTKRELRLDVLALDGRPVGVTAVFVLRYDTAGATERNERVAGSLFLTKERGRWRIFGFDVTKGASA